MKCKVNTFFPKLQILEVLQSFFSESVADKSEVAEPLQGRFRHLTLFSVSRSVAAFAYNHFSCHALSVGSGGNLDDYLSRTRGERAASVEGEPFYRQLRVAVYAVYPVHEPGGKRVGAAEGSGPGRD